MSEANEHVQPAALCELVSRALPRRARVWLRCIPNGAATTTQPAINGGDDMQIPAYLHASSRGFCYLTPRLAFCQTNGGEHAGQVQKSKRVERRAGFVCRGREKRSWRPRAPAAAPFRHRPKYRVKNSHSAATGCATATELPQIVFGIYQFPQIVFSISRLADAATEPVRYPSASR